MTPRIRAVVVNYSGGEEVLGCLRALLASDWPADSLEVVVVDNGSTDGSPERIAAELPQVRLHRSPGNLGYPAINQVVTDLTGVDLVAIVNPDAVVAPDCLGLLAAALEDEAVGAACPRILLDGDYREVVVGLDGPPRASLDLLAVTGAARWHLTGPRVRKRWHRGLAWAVGDGSVLRTTADAGSPVTLTVRAHAPGTVTLTSGGVVTTASLSRGTTRLQVVLGGEAHPVVQNAGSLIARHGVGVNRGYHRLDGPAFDVATDVPAWCGAAALLRADYLRDVGLLDPRWFLYYEDTDLAWRGLLRGWRHRYVPEARVRHAHSTSIGHGSALYELQHERNRLLTLVKDAPAAAVRAAWVEALRLVVAQLRADVAGRVRDRRLPEPVMTTRRLRALGRAARMAPRVLPDRRRVRSAARVADADLPVLGAWRDPVPDLAEQT